MRELSDADLSMVAGGYEMDIQNQPGADDQGYYRQY
jgi:hypothetical protein